MKRTLIVSTITYLSYTGSAMAVEIYRDENNTLELGGYLSPIIVNSQNETELASNSSRINISYLRELDNGWRALALLEWGINPFGNSNLVFSGDSNFEVETGDFLFNRLGYIMLENDKYGSISFGKQWGVWYDVAYGTNLGFVWDGDSAGVYTFNKGDGGVNGVGRADNAVQYRNTFGDFSFGLQAQLKQGRFELDEGQGINFPVPEPSGARRQNYNRDPGNPFPDHQVAFEYNNSVGASATYNITENLAVAAGANVGQIKIDFSRMPPTPEPSMPKMIPDNFTHTETDVIYGGSVTYGGDWDTGFYASANINHQKFHDTDNLGRFIPAATGGESIISYRFDDSPYRIFAQYNILKADDSYAAAYAVDPEGPKDIFRREFFVGGLHYIFRDDLVFYLEARQDLGKFVVHNDEFEQIPADFGEHSAVAVGVRFFL